MYRPGIYFAHEGDYEPHRGCSAIKEGQPLLLPLNVRINAI